MAQGKKTTLFNPNTTAVVYDKEGRIVEGGGRREVDEVGEVAREAIDHGLLVEESGDEPETGDDSADQPKDKAVPSRKTSGASQAGKSS